MFPGFGTADICHTNKYTNKTQQYDIESLTGATYATMAEDMEAELLHMSNKYTLPVVTLQTMTFFQP